MDLGSGARLSPGDPFFQAEVIPGVALLFFVGESAIGAECCEGARSPSGLKGRSAPDPSPDSPHELHTKLTSLHGAPHASQLFARPVTPPIPHRSTPIRLPHAAAPCLRPSMSERRSRHTVFPALGNLRTPRSLNSPVREESAMDRRTCASSRGAPHNARIDVPGARTRTACSGRRTPACNVCRCDAFAPAARRDAEKDRCPFSPTEGAR